METNKFTLKIPSIGYEGSKTLKIRKKEGIVNACFVETLDNNLYTEVKNGVISNELYIKVTAEFSFNSSIHKTVNVKIFDYENNFIKKIGLEINKTESGQEYGISKFKFSTEEKEKIKKTSDKLFKLYLQVEYYEHNDDTSNCKSFESTYLKDNLFKLYPCYCNKDFNTGELKNIILKLRKNTGTYYTLKVKDIRNKIEIHKHYTSAFDDDAVYKKGDIYLYNHKKVGYYNIATYKKVTLTVEEKKSLNKIIDESIFISKRTEKIKESDDYSLFTKYLNKTFKQYKIGSCIRKIHFLAQTYHETGHFNDTYENYSNKCLTYNGGCDFRGRGIKQITHDYNYLACYDESERLKRNNSNLFEIYMNKRCSKTIKLKNKDGSFKKNKKGKIKTKVINDSVTTYLEKNGTTHGFPKDFLTTLKDYSKKISTDLEYACMSAGFFWEYREIYSYADSDDVKGLTEEINGGNNGLSERKKYTKSLKKIFNYEKKNCPK